MTLIGVVTFLGRAFSPPAESSAAQPDPDPVRETASRDAEAASTESAEAPETDFHQIALSAYAYHRRATTRVRSNEASTSWLVAGRIRELDQRRAGN